MAIPMRGVRRDIVLAMFSSTQRPQVLKGTFCHRRTKDRRFTSIKFQFHYLELNFKFFEHYAFLYYLAGSAM